jgi:23S rRNA (cytidine2498-2'-O)-methyltransferase
VNSAARTAYLAAEGFAAELAQEIGPVDFAHDRLLVAAGAAKPAAWAQNVWLDPIELSIESIGDAARRSSAIGRSTLHASIAARR